MAQLPAPTPAQPLGQGVYNQPAGGGASGVVQGGGVSGVTPGGGTFTPQLIQSSDPVTPTSPMQMIKSGGPNVPTPPSVPANQISQAGGTNTPTSPQTPLGGGTTTPNATSQMMLTSPSLPMAPIPGAAAPAVAGLQAATPPPLAPQGFGTSPAPLGSGAPPAAPMGFGGPPSPYTPPAANPTPPPTPPGGGGQNTLQRPPLRSQGPIQGLQAAGPSRPSY